RLTGILAEPANETAFAHRRDPAQGANPQVAIEVLLAPRLHLLDGGNRGELRAKLRRKLRLTTGAFEKQHQRSRDGEGKVATMVFFDQRQSEIDPGGDPGRAVHIAVTNKDRIDIHLGRRTASRQFRPELPMRRRPLAVEQTGGTQHKGASADGTE